MKKTVLLTILIISFLGTQAQTKSTGTVALPVSGMTAKLDLDNTLAIATLTLTGPSDRWFALQFGSFVSGDGMQVGEDVVYYNGTTLVDAVHNGIGSAPSADTNNWTVTLNTVAAGTRTIMATRAFSTGNANDYTFVYADASIDFACAKMGSATFSLAYHGGGNRGYAIDVPISTALGVNDFEQNKIAFYPNPASTSFSIQSEDAIRSVVVYDATGKQILSFKGQKEAIDISGLPNGIYFVEIENTGSTIFIEKLIKE
jgi:hypothetical protein